LQAQGDPNVQLIARRYGKMKVNKYRLTKPAPDLPEPEPDPEIHPF